MQGSDPQRQPAQHTDVLVSPEHPWVLVIWDDPVNLMSYVVYVFRQYFGYRTNHAEKLMLRVHNFGSSVVASGTRQEMELHVEAMHEFGLWATVRKEGDE